MTLDEDDGAAAACCYCCACCVCCVCAVCAVAAFVDGPELGPHERRRGVMVLAAAPFPLAPCPCLPDQRRGVECRHHILLVSGMVLFSSPVAVVRSTKASVPFGTRSPANTSNADATPSQGNSPCDKEIGREGGIVRAKHLRTRSFPQPTSPRAPCRTIPGKRKHVSNKPLVHTPTPITNHYTIKTRKQVTPHPTMPSLLTRCLLGAAMVASALTRRRLPHGQCRDSRAGQGQGLR